MTLALAPAILFLFAQAAAAPEPYRDPVDLFMRICTEGGGGFAPGTIETISAIDVAGVRDRVGRQRHNRFYRVSSGDWQAFLALQDTIAESDPRNTRHCTVASRSLDFREAVRGIFPGRKPREGRRSFGELYIHQSPMGHRVTIQRLSGGYVSMTALVPGPEAMRDEDVIVAFRDACDRSHGRYAVAAKGEALGWEEVPAGAHPGLERLIGAAAAGSEALSARAFSRDIGDRPVFAIVAEGADGSAGPGTSCRLYDFDAGGPMDAGLIARWARPAAADPRERLAAGIEHLLRPDWAKDMAVEFLHAPADSALAREYGFSGNLLAVRPIGDR